LKMMLCPCCATRMQPGTLECSCGARIVGDPLGGTPFRVRRYGPIMIAVGVTAAVTTAALIFSSWLALGAVLPILLSNRAFQLAKRDPALYGGYRTAAGSLALCLIASFTLVSHAIIGIPDYLEKQEIGERAEEQAKGLHVAGLLEQYRAQHDGSYPATLEPIREKDNGSLPAEFWSKMIRYEGVYGAVAARGGVGSEITNFELRLAGPDGIMGTEDDIVMRDGIFYSNPDPIKAPSAKEPALH
jgi:hypothetical protein